MFKFLFLCLVFSYAVGAYSPSSSISLLDKNQIWSIGQKIADLDPNQFFDAFEDRKLLRNLTAFLQTISYRAANIVSISSTNGNVFMWDLLRSEFRARVLAQANYSLVINESLSWSSIPVDVQAIVAARLQNVSSNPQFSSITSQLSDVVATIRYDMLIDTSIVKKKIALVIDELVDFYVSASENTRYTKRDKICRNSEQKKLNTIIKNIMPRHNKSN